MSYLIIDAHAHLWDELSGSVEGYDVKSIGGGKATFNGGIRQMMPPYMLDGKNTAELFVSNMNYDCVSAAVITQEYLDGNQNDYLLKVKGKYGTRLKIAGLCDFRRPGFLPEVKRMCKGGFNCIKVPAQRLVNLPKRVYLTDTEMLKAFEVMDKSNIILSIDLAQGETQVDEMKELIYRFPNLKIAIGHFGMANRPGFESQILLAKNKNVMIESGGITWLYHNEFYPYVGAVNAIKKAIDMVGVEKLMWGSDYPRTMTAITYRMSYDFIIKSNVLSQAEKISFLGENAKSFYGFKDLEVPQYIKNMVED
ncbi:amidohydrolase family protein [Clostridium lacusfryxellense]|uniref:amidohydrolase family protein n=1 Tax=Clostridium lacusfryxellense TaxID=205328 RepID=UPI001C0E3AF4|nr:amidohydrolase family protein [Clostridium lacusfryxellense]MBU3112742.1 amidohydrolase [Clostridium lacusfryxellense]